MGTAPPTVLTKPRTAEPSASAAPTLDDARAAAEAMAAADPRVERVYLFGSVARGEARPGSDIDMIAIVNDHPDALKAAMGALSNAAMREIDIDVDVLVRTPAEWKHMVSNVSSSIDRGASDLGVMLFSSQNIKPPASARVDRMPADNLDNAVREVRSITAELRRLRSSIRGLDTVEAGSDEHQDLCAGALRDSHMTIERSIAAVLAAVDGRGYKSGHNFNKALDEIGQGEEHSEMREVIESLRSRDGEIRTWRHIPYVAEQEGYEDEMNAVWVSVWVHAALDCASIVADVIQDRAADPLHQEQVQILREAIAEIETLKQGRLNWQPSFRTASASQPSGDLNPDPIALSQEPSQKKPGFFRRFFSRSKGSPNRL